jgi:DNA-directed RNA polymerase specialized sigma24 family protein
MVLEPDELAALAAYVPRVVANDPLAWQELASRLEPLLIRFLRRSKTLGPMRHSVDDCRTVMVKVLERLRKDEHRSLRLYATWADANPSKSFGDWMRILTTNLARDHVASRLGAADQDARGGPHNKRMLHTLATLLPEDGDDRLAARPAMTDAMMARELLESAQRLLDGDQMRALRRWMDGASFEELAEELGLPSARDADKRVRAALARLRRHFADESS